jgi:ABC-type transport system involved in cytochrome c biogenesis permease subunit
MVNEMNILEINDMINGAFELASGFLVYLNLRRIYIDKKIAGISLYPVLFSLVWSYWYLYYYFALNQIASFICGIPTTIIDTAWLILAAYYTYNNKVKNKEKQPLNCT